MNACRTRLPIAGVMLLVIGVCQFQTRLAGAEVGYVESTSRSGSFPIVGGNQAAAIFVEASDWPGVARAAGDLQADVQRVTGKSPALVGEEKALGKQPIIVGTLGKSPLVDRLVQSGKIDVADIRGKWESFLVQVVRQPLPSVESALVIIGSDKRGTIYGIYDLSQQMGVSPWHWWADVPVRHRDELFVKAGRYTSGEPAVRYRGIFLNDESPALSGWVREKFGQAKQSTDPPVPAGVANMNHEFYARVFELLLRLRGNYLWPAMWNNAFNEDDAENAKLADEYGIVMGTSHQEPMLRAQKEWDRRYRGQRWNYYTDPKTLQDFWREGIARNKNYESILTLGLRGANDTPMILGGTPEQSAELLKKIIADQRQMISDVVNPDPSKVPQLWCPYKEVLEYYDRLGLRVPDDVTILWPDDNWGNLRRLPSAEERKHSGGAGIYYHFDYVGGPRNYKWINTNPLPKVWEQMTQALVHGANRIWIVNVGDLKPLELPISFFLKLAWEGKNFHQEQVAQFTRDWAAQQFGSDHADEIAELLAKFGKYAGRRKHELIDSTTFNVVNYNEADHIVAEWSELTNRAEALSQKLPADERDAFFQLVLHPIKASLILTEMYVAAAKNKLYAAQGRASANDWAKNVRELFQADQVLSDYYNQKLAGGKWSHMMDQKHIGYTNWQEPQQNNMPRVQEITVSEGTAMGVAVEGSESAWPKPAGEAALPPFDAFNLQRRAIELFRTGSAAFDFTAAASDPWMALSSERGSVDADVRIWVSIDWKKVPPGTASGSVKIDGAGSTVVVKVEAFNPEQPTRESLTGFVESEGFVSIEAEHYTKKVDGPAAKWDRLDDYGRTLSAMSVFPMTAASVTPPQNSPCLEYRMYLFDSGPAEVQSILGPTLDFLPGMRLRYAVSFDDAAPQIISAVPEQKNRDGLPRDWDTTVRDSVRVSKSTHMLDKPGYHTLKFWMVDPAVVLEKIVINLGGVKPCYLGPPESFRGASP